MAELTIQGRKITVDDSFLSLTPEEQEATVDEIAASLGGDFKPLGELSIPEPSPFVDSLVDGANAIGLNGGRVRNDLNSLSAGVKSFLNPLGLGDVAKAGFSTATGDNTFSENLESERQSTRNTQSQFPKASLAGEIAGGTLLAGGLAKGGLTAARFANPTATGGKALLQSSGALAVDGGALGFVDAAARGNDVLTGTAIGAGGGAVSSLLAPALSSVGRTVGGLLGIGNQSRAKEALSEAVKRSGKTPNQILQELSEAATDGQPLNIADALGNSGQRMLSGVARSPGDARQKISETLTNRQLGQGDRITNALSEGFEAPDTALQRTATLKDKRTQTARDLYNKAIAGAGSVDNTPTLSAIDERLAPGVQKFAQDNIAGDSIDSSLARVKSRLTDGESNLSDFQRTLSLKQDIADDIESAIRQGRGNQASQLTNIRNELDKSLEQASDGYRIANDTFRQDSQVIDAVGKGQAATSGRLRSDDTIPAFKGLSEPEQGAFRAGYVDPLIARVQSSSASPTTNKVRPLLTPKLQEEFSAFAAPNQADRLANRLNREQTMFETNNIALGGSKTADNLADQADIGSFDPTVISNVLSGNFKQAAINGIARSANGIGGRNQATRDLIADMLLQTSPTKASAELSDAIRHGKKITESQRNKARLLISSAIATTN